MNKVLLALVALIIVAGGAYLLLGQETANAPENQMNGETEMTGGENENGSGIGVEVAVGDPEFHALISYTENGYEPSSVTIKKGQTVRFVNNHSSQETWPASAIHPTHGIYPEKSASDCLGSSFDSCRGLKAGEFWEFTFDEVGAWRFHDHLHASKTGVVNVTE